MHQPFIHLAPCAAVLVVCILAHAAPAGSLPLKPGTYVASSDRPCAEAPFAAVKAFDGKAFSGPHESACTSSIVGRQGHRYRVSTVCHALGDGTPTPETEALETIRVRSSSSFDVTTSGRATRYDLCPAFH